MSEGRAGADDPLAAFRDDPPAAGIFTDFDGTLSPIVDDPATAEPLPGVPELLGRLAGQYGMVAVVSGRPVAFLADRVPPSVLLAGLYGLEVQVDGELVLSPDAERWREVVDAARAQSEAAAPPGVLVESKGLSLTLHYRSDPGLESTVVALAEDVAADTGLVVHAARRSVELRAAVDVDKGTVVREHAAGLRAACYLGDDIGDLAAFAALDDLAGQGIRTVRVAVRSDESPAELLRAADVTVDGPDGAAALLRTLLPGD